MVMDNKQLAYFAATLGLVTIAGVAQASPVTYDYTGNGTITITAYNQNGNVIDLDGGTSAVLQFSSQSNLSFVTFDSSSSATNPLSAFQFTAAVPLTVDVTSGSFQGLDINVSALEMNNAAGSTSTVNGLSFTAGPVSASTTYTLSGLITNNTPTTKSGTNTSIGGSILSGPGDFQLNGITIGTWTVGSNSVTLQANVEFNGAPVPLPPAVWLFGSGLAMLALPRLRRRRTA
jgi:hypothetical protein